VVRHRFINLSICTYSIRNYQLLKIENRPVLDLAFYKAKGARMKSMKEIMAEMGFNKDAPLDTQKAFFKNLVQAANAQLPRSEPQAKTVGEIATVPIVPAKPAAPKRSRKAKAPIKEQLEFTFSDIDRVS